MNQKIFIFLIVLVLASAVGLVGVFTNSDDDNVLDADSSDTLGFLDNQAQAPAENSQDQQNVNKQQTMSKAVLKTTKGDIYLEFFPSLAPNTVANFQKLAESGFYEGVVFHRVIEGFMIQGGDPTGTGMGGPGYTFDDELDPNSEIAKEGYKRGTLAMANSGPNTNGSQFFIVHQDTGLPYQYTIFGQVTDGMEVVDAIAGVEVDPNDKPLEDVVIEEVIMEE